METSLARRDSSLGVRPDGRSAARRVKRTSVDIWRRDWVRVKMFSGVNWGRVLRRKKSEVMKRIVRARETGAGMGRMGMPWIVGAARALR